MADLTRPAPGTRGARHDHGGASYRAYRLLQLGFVALPLIMGIDKFVGALTDWPQYLAPWISDLLPMSAQATMYVVGVVEILAAVAVALKPRYAAYVIAAWLGGIILNLLTLSGYYDVAVRDLGLLVGALALALLAADFDPPLRSRTDDQIDLRGDAHEHA